MKDQRFLIKALKKTKSQPLKHYQTKQTVWDGVNTEIVVDDCPDEETANFVLNNFKITSEKEKWARAWKFWIVKK